MRRLILLLALVLACSASRSQTPAAPGTIITIAGNGAIGFSGDGGPATNASLNQITGIAFGPDGTLYIADEGNLRIRAVNPATKVIRTIAGSGNSGDEGNNGPAISANLGGVIGIATDRVRNALYITDWPNNWIRKVNLTDGIITLYAGSGGFGMSGDGGPATLAKLSFPIDAAIDADGRLSFVDSGNKRICRVDPATGVISTIAGSAGLGPTGDGGPATSAAFGNAIRLAADPAGNVYVRDGDPNGTYFTVRRIDATTGIISTIVGGGSNPEGTGVATSMLFKNIECLAANGHGELFVATPLRVFKLNIATGIIAPFAGDGISGFGNEGDSTLSARFAYITSIAVAPDGGLVIGDTDNSRVRLVTPQPKQPPTSSGQVITIAGNGSGGFSGDGGPATDASLSGVAGLTVGPDGTIYISDSDNYRIRAIDPKTGFIRTIAGNGTVGNLGNGGPATEAGLSFVSALTVDAARNALYTADLNNNVVRKINLTDGIINIYAGTGTIGYTGDGGAAKAARLRRPWGIATDAIGRLSIAAHYRVRQVNPLNGIITTIAGTDASDFAPDGFPAVSTTFHGITKLAADRAGNVFILEGFSSEPRFVRRIDVATGLVSTVAGGGANTPGTGVAKEMLFMDMWDIAVSDANELFITTPNQLFRVDLTTGLMAPAAGNGTQGFSGDGGPALAAQFNLMSAVAVMPGGGIVLADHYNYRIRYVAPGSINLSGDSGQTSFALPWVSALTGDLVVKNQPTLTQINLGNITSVSGVVSLGNNTAAAEVDLGSLVSAGNVSITGNTSATVISMGELGSVAGEVDISGNTKAGEVDLRSLLSAGSVSITGNTSATVISMGSATTVVGEVEITGNTSASEIDLRSLLSAGAVAISGNTSAEVISLGALGAVAGDVTIEGNGTNAVISLTSLTNFGCAAAEVTLTLDGFVVMTNGLTICTNATLAGSATVDGAVTNNGTIEPGSSPGQLDITGNLHLGASSRLNLEIGGVAATQFDSVHVDGNVILGGNLTVRLLAGFTDAMANGSSFTVVTSGGPLTGTFANVASGATLLTADGRARLTVRYAGENTVRLTDLQILSATAGQPAVPSGRIITIAGNGIAGYSGDGGPATSASFSGVEGLAFGPDGTLYIADSGNFRIRAVNPLTGIIRTIAGTGVEGDDGNDGPATNATMSAVIGLGTDRVRNILYLADWANNQMRKVNLNNGILSAVTGGVLGFGGDGGPALSAKTLFPISTGTDAAGRLSFVDTSNTRIRQVDPVTGIITTIAGNGELKYSGDGGLAVNAKLGDPIRLTADSAGNVFIRDGNPADGSQNVRQIEAATGVIRTVVGGGAGPRGTGIATNMFFDAIFEVAAEGGELYVALTWQVCKVNLATGLIAPFAGDGTGGPGIEGVPALTTKFENLTAVAVAPGGGLVIADSTHERIYYVAPESIHLSDDSGQTSFALPWVTALTGNLVLENNASITSVNAAALVSVTGELVLSGNGAVGNLDLGSLENTGNLIITDNPALTSVNLGSLETVTGNLILQGNGSVGNLDLGSLETVSGDLTLENNGSTGNLDLGSLETVSGNLTIEEPATGNLDLGSLAEVSGNLTVESNETGNLDLSSLTEYGCGTNEVTMTLDGSFGMTNGLTLCTNATLAGNATVDGSITNNGTIEPGSSPGLLNITGNLHLGSSSRLILEIGGYAPAQIDKVNVGGNVVLGGTLTVRLLDSFITVITNGASFTLLTSARPLTGAFANVPSGAVLQTADGRGRFKVLYTGQNTLRVTDFQIRNDSPALRIVSIEPQPSALRITWNAVPGTTYRVQSAATLGNFTDESAAITASPTDTTLHFDAPIPAEATRFFQIRAIP